VVLVTDNTNDELAEVFADFLNALEAACVNAKHQIGELKGIADQKTQKTQVVVQETVFNILKFEPQQGAKIGSYEVAYRANNIAEKWTQAYNILRNSNATINVRYHSEDYEFSYWLYGEGKIYRQKLKKR
jgi:hypothetical protein